MDAFADLLANSREFYFYLAIGGSVIFVFQLVLILIGIGGDDFDVVSDADSSDLDLSGGGDLTLVSFFSIRSLIAFVTFFGWAGFFWGHTIAGFLISIFCGLVMMVLTTLTVWLFIRMQKSGNVNNEDFLGQVGSVYLTIKADETGLVTVRLPDCTRQIRALADEELKAGTTVKVVDILGGDLFKVEKI